MKSTLPPVQFIGNDGISMIEYKAPSPSAIRRQKMNKLRKVLGDNVPVHLVFPDQKSAPELVKEPKVDLTDENRSFGTPGTRPGIRRLKKARSGKIIGTRDSMNLVATHSAKRQETQESEKFLSPLPPLPPIVIPASCIPRESSQEHLCIIVENPDENDSISSEGFCFPSSALNTRSL